MFLFLLHGLMLGELPTTNSYHAFWHVKVVGSIEQTGDTDDSKPEKESDSASDSKNGAKPMDVDKAKTKRKLYVGQELEFRRDNMEVSACACWGVSSVIICWWSSPHSPLQVISPMKDGTVTDWDIVDNIWNHAFRWILLPFCHVSKKFLLATFCRVSFESEHCYCFTLIILC